MEWNLQPYKLKATQNECPQMSTLGEIHPLSLNNLEIEAIILMHFGKSRTTLITLKTEKLHSFPVRFALTTIQSMHLFLVSNLTESFIKESG